MPKQARPKRKARDDLARTTHVDEDYSECECGRRIRSDEAWCQRCIRKMQDERA
jgi:hypothetical protein